MNDDNRSKINKRMLEMGVAPKRSLGQNFLVADHVIQRIISKVAHYKPKRMIEIGPGLGALTESLIKMNAVFRRGITDGRGIIFGERSI